MSTQNFDPTVDPRIAKFASFEYLVSPCPPAEEPRPEPTANDMRNALQALTNVYYLLASDANLAAEQRALLATAQGEVTRLARLVDSLYGKCSATTR